MEKPYTTKQFKITGMSCINCENKITQTLQTTKGITKVKVSYQSSICTLTYNRDVLHFAQIKAIINDLGYGVEALPTKKTNNGILDLITMLVILFALYKLAQYFGILTIFSAFPIANENMGYGMLFIIGLVTSIHCIAMCGGISLTQCLPQNTYENKTNIWKASALYNIGRVLSYTCIGAIIGGLGTVISFSGAMKGIVQIIAAIFMIIMGLNMLHLFPSLRKFNVSLPLSLRQKMHNQKRNHGPLYVGLLNGLMPCGPLQAMQLYALSTADPFKGALAMFLFSLGSVPLMFAFGALTSFLSKKFTATIMKVGAVFIVVLGFSMLNSGFLLSGYSTLGPTTKQPEENTNIARVEEGVQLITTTLDAYNYTPIYVQANIPVKWTIQASSENINGCNNTMIIPEYNIEHTFAEGENIIEFTPTKTGTITYSCWMGMIRSTISVSSAGEATKTQTNKDTPKQESELPSCHFN